MSVPFSNTHLRVPRGFGTILEGLAREVLRDQPEDILTYAMKYFDALLKQREESGVDPAEWAARLEDRFYNNHAFKNTETTYEEESESEATFSEGKSHKPQTEDESSHSAEVSALSATPPDVSGKDDSTEGSDEKEKVNITERFTLAAEKECSKGNSNADIQSDEESNTDEEKDPPNATFDQADRHNIEMDDNPVSDENISQFHSELTDLLSFKEFPNEDLFSHESEDDGGDHQGGTFVENKTVDSEEENTEVTEAAEAVPYSGPADVDICAAELGRTEKPLERRSAQDNTHVGEEEESLNLQIDTELSQYEISQGSQQEAEDQAQSINGGGGVSETEASHEETYESSALIENNFDDNPVLKEDNLVEVSFEDVPEAQHITEDGEETLMDDASVEILQNTELEMQETEESIELTTSSADQNISDTEEQLKPEMEEVKKDVMSEEEEIESHHASFDTTKENVDTDNSNLHDSNNDEMETGAKSISSSDQPNTEAEKQIEENEADHKDTKEKFEETFYQKQVPVKEKESDDPDYERNETDMGNEDEEEKCTVGHGEIGDHEINDGKADENSAHATKSHLSVTGMEEKEETTEESVLHQPQENKQSPRTDVDSQQEDSSEEKEGAGEYTKTMADLKVQETSEEMEKQEIASLTHSTNWTAADNEEEEGPNEYEKDATASANKSDKEECSRPQEEEDIMDIPLDDPEANRAAAKIQAGFRGHMTRKKMKPEDKTEGEEVSSTGDVLNSSQGVSETGRSGAVERDDTSVPEQ